MDDDQLKEVTSRLDTIIRLIASDKIETKNVKEKVEYLAKAGLTATQIAKLIGKPINTVTSYTSRLNKG
jgi:hypothetical protein